MFLFFDVDRDVFRIGISRKKMLTNLSSVQTYISETKKSFHFRIQSVSRDRAHFRIFFKAISRIFLNWTWKSEKRIWSQIIFRLESLWIRETSSKRRRTFVFEFISKWDQDRIFESLSPIEGFSFSTIPFLLQPSSSLPQVWLVCVLLPSSPWPFSNEE